MPKVDIRKKYAKFLPKTESDSTQSAGSCPQCCGTEVVQIGSEILCAKCHVVLDELLSDKMSFESGDGDGSSAILNELAPTLSTRTYITGAANKMIKQMMMWNSFSYREKVALDIYNFMKNKCRIYEKFRTIKIHSAKFRNISKALLIEKVQNPNNFEKKADEIIEKYQLRVGKINEEIIGNSVKIFKILMDKFITRIPVKYGVIACCYYYACKEFYIILSRTELSIIFDADLEIITKGFNKVNSQAKKYADLHKYIDRQPIKFEDYIEKLQWNFPEMTAEKMYIFRIFLDRISGDPISRKYTPPSIIGGLLNNCSRVYKFGITPSDIVARFYISNSTLNKYSKMTKPYVYEI